MRRLRAAGKGFVVMVLVLLHTANASVMLWADSQTVSRSPLLPNGQKTMEPDRHQGITAAAVESQKALQEIIRNNPTPPPLRPSRSSTAAAALPLTLLTPVAYPVQYPLLLDGTTTFSNGVSVETSQGAIVDVAHNGRGILTVMSDSSNVLRQLGGFSSGSVSYMAVAQAEGILRDVVSQIQSTLTRLDEALQDAVIPQGLIDSYKTNVLARFALLQSQADAYRSAVQYRMVVPTMGYACVGGADDSDCILRTPASGTLTVYANMPELEAALSQAVQTASNGALYFEGLSAGGYDALLPGIDASDVLGLLSFGQVRTSESIDINGFSRLYNGSLNYNSSSADGMLGETRKLLVRLIQRHALRVVTESLGPDGNRIGFVDSEAFVNLLLGVRQRVNGTSFFPNGVTVCFRSGVIADVTQNGQSVIRTLSQAKSALLALPAPSGSVSPATVDQAEVVLRQAVAQVQQILKNFDTALGTSYFVDTAVAPFQNDVTARITELRDLVHNQRYAAQYRFESPALGSVPVIADMNNLSTMLARALIDRLGGAMAFEGYDATAYLALPGVQSQDIAGLLSNGERRKLESFDKNLLTRLYNGAESNVSSSEDYALADYEKLVVRLVKKFGAGVMNVSTDANGNLLWVVNADSFYRALLDGTPPLPSFIRSVSPSGVTPSPLAWTLVHRYLEPLNLSFSQTTGLFYPPVPLGAVPWKVVYNTQTVITYRSFPDASNLSVAVYMTVFKGALKPGVNFLSVSNFTILDPATGESWIYIGPRSELYRSRSQDSVVLPGGSRLTFNSEGALSVIQNGDGSKIQILYAGGHVTEIAFIEPDGKKISVTVDAAAMDRIRIPDKYGYFFGSSRFVADGDAPAFSAEVLSNPILLMDIRSLEAAVKDALQRNFTIGGFTLKDFKLDRLICTADIPASACSGRTRVVLETPALSFRYGVNSGLSPRDRTAYYAVNLESIGFLNTLPGQDTIVYYQDGVITDISQSGQSVVTLLSQAKAALLALPAPSGSVSPATVDQAEVILRQAVAQAQQILQSLDQALGNNSLSSSAVTPFQEDVLRRVGELRVLVNNQRTAAQYRLESSSLGALPVTADMNVLETTLVRALIEELGSVAIEGYNATAYLALPGVSSEDIDGLLSNGERRARESVDQNLFAALYNGAGTGFYSSGDGALADHRKLVTRLINKFGSSVVEVRTAAQGNRTAAVNADLFYQELFKQAVSLADGTRITFDQTGNLSTVRNADGSKIGLVYTEGKLSSFVLTQPNGDRQTVSVSASAADRIRIPNKEGQFADRPGGSVALLSKQAVVRTASVSANWQDPTLLMDIRAVESAVKNGLAAGDFFSGDILLSQFSLDRMICTADIPISSCSASTSITFEQLSWIYAYRVDSGLSPRSGTASYQAALISKIPPAFVQSVQASGGQITSLAAALINSALSPLNKSYDPMADIARPTLYRFPAASNSISNAMSWRKLSSSFTTTTYYAYPNPKDTTVVVYWTVFNRFLRPGVNFLSVSNFTVLNKKTGESWLYIGSRGELRRLK